MTSLYNMVSNVIQLICLQDNWTMQFTLQGLGGAAVHECCVRSGRMLSLQTKCSRHVHTAD